MVKAIFAQPIQTPSVPKFTLELVDYSYDVPPVTTTTIDQFTGKEVVTTTPGYRVENKSIEITVKNQPFTPYDDAEGHLINLYYDVRFKGHFGSEADWEQPFYKPIRNGIYGTTKQNPQSSSEYTVISFSSEFQDGDVVDFQVQTLEGFYTLWEPILAVHMGTSQFTGKSSGWSNTQTITISEFQIPSPEPTIPTSLTPMPHDVPEPAELEVILGAVFIVVIIGSGLGLLVYLLKKK